MVPVLYWPRATFLSKSGLGDQHLSYFTMNWIERWRRGGKAWTPLTALQQRCFHSKSIIITAYCSLQILWFGRNQKHSLDVRFRLNGMSSGHFGIFRVKHDSADWWQQNTSHSSSSGTRATVVCGQSRGYDFSQTTSKKRKNRVCL